LGTLLFLKLRSEPRSSGSDSFGSSTHLRWVAVGKCIVAACSDEDQALETLISTISSRRDVEQAWILDTSTLTVLRIELSGDVPKLVRIADPLIDRLRLSLSASRPCLNDVAMLMKMGLKIVHASIRGSRCNVVAELPRDRDRRIEVAKTLREKQLKNLVNGRDPSTALTTEKPIDECIDLLII